MNVFADAYSRYLAYNFNYINRTKLFQKYFKNSIVFITDPKFITKNFIDQIDKFPKYPYFFNPISKPPIGSFNIRKIYESSLDNTDKLLESMSDTPELAKKPLYDSIPVDINDFLEELCFQFSYTSKSIDLYNFDLITRSFVADKQYRNFFSDLYTNGWFPYSDQTDNGCFNYQFILYTCLYNIFSSSHNIYVKLLSYITYMNEYGSDIDKVNNTTMLNDFQSFTTTYDHSMSIDLANIIGKSIYGYNNTSAQMRGNIVEVIERRIHGSDSMIDDNGNLIGSFYKNFENFFTTIDLSPVNFIIANIVNCINSFVSVDIMSTIYKSYDSKSVINDPPVIPVVDKIYKVGPSPTGVFIDHANQIAIYNSGWTFTDIIIDDKNTNILYSEGYIFEEDQYNDFISRISEPQLKNYMFLAFLYKFWPLKFLNVIQLTIREYVEDYIKTPEDDVREKLDFQRVFKMFCNNIDDSGAINYTNLKTFLDNTVSALPSLISDSSFAFIYDSNSVYCSDWVSYSSVNVNEYIYSSEDDRSKAGHVISKEIVPSAVENITGVTLSGLVGNFNISNTYVLSFTISGNQRYLSWNGGPATLISSSGSYLLTDDGTTGVVVTINNMNILPVENRSDNIEVSYVLILERDYVGTTSPEWIQAYKYTYTSSSYIYKVIMDNQLGNFGCLYYYFFVLDRFFVSTYYDNFVKSLTQAIFVQLRNYGHIDYTFDWYRYHDAIDIYLKTFLRWKLIDNSVRYILSDFNNAKVKFVNGSNEVICAESESYNKILNGDYIYAENDTSDKAVLVSSHFIEGDGTYKIVLESPYQGTTTNLNTFVNVYGYNSNVTLFNTVTNNIVGKLLPRILNNTSDAKYNVDIVFPTANEIETLCKSLSMSEAFLGGMHRFTENLELSAVTRNIIYSILSNYI